jgi:hypothetical protein
MVFSGNINVLLLCATILFNGITTVEAAFINFSGQLNNIEYDTGVGVYSGVAIGTSFSGKINDVSANGTISDGVTFTSFGCCIAAGGLSILNNEALSEDDAAILNAIIGFSKYSAGDQIDIINIEGDTTTSIGGRIEIGLSYILNSATFANNNIDNYPFNHAEIELAFFFIYEEDALGRDAFHGVGQIQIDKPTSKKPVPGIPLLLLD